MSYYLKSVDFSNPESIKNCDITEFVRLCKQVFDFYNIHQRDYYSTNEKIESNLQENIHKLEYIFDKFKNSKELEDLRKLFDQTKYKNHQEELFTKKIRIYYMTLDEEEYFVNLFENQISTYYHPYSSIEPLWVSILPFPNHSGDEEGFYIVPGLDSWIDVISTERAYRIKKRNIILKIDNRFYAFTIGRTAHS